MALKVSCPNCMSLLSVPRKLRGKVVVCPCCKEKCRVPLPATVALPKHATVVADDPVIEGQVRPYDASRASWIRTALIASVAAAVVAVGALILNTAIGVGRTRNLIEANEAQANAADANAASAGDGDRQTAANGDLADQAQQVLKDHCYRCHGQDGVAEGGFNYVLRREKLVLNDNYVSPGKPDDSFLFTRVSGGEMPPAGETRLSKNDVDVLRRWIAAGAPDFDAPLNRPFLSNEYLVSAIRKDLETNINQRDHKFARYFTLTNLFNAGFTDDEMQTYRLALSKLVNSLSWHRSIVQPLPVDAHNTVLRVDTRTLGWGEEVWPAIIEANPYSVRFDEDDLDSKFCTSATGCDIPHVRADWFVAAASRPPLYHTVMQVPGTLKDLLAKHFSQIDLEKDIKQESVVRVGFSNSGVSQNNRMLEWHHSPYGSFWLSYDFAGNKGRKELVRHPLGPGSGETDFEHDGGEIIFSLPNGLQGYMLIDAKGNRLDKGPTQIVSDPKRPDRAVTNGVSCMSCHYRGVISKADKIRPVVQANKKTYNDPELILALYPPQKEIDELFNEDASRFTRAVNEVGIKELTETGEPIVNMSFRFDTEVDARNAAAELGLKLDDFLSRLRGNPTVQDRLVALTVEGGTMKRETFANQFPFVVEGFRLGKPLKLAKADKPKPAEPPKPGETTEPPKTSAPAEKVEKPGGIRTWTDRNGTSVEAEFVNLDGDKVELRKANGGALQIPLGDLSPDDQKFVREKLKDAPDTALPPGEKIAAPAAAAPPQPGPPAPVTEFRVWRNVFIRKTVKASFFSLVKGDLKLQEERLKGKGIYMTWPMEDLSDADKAYVKQQVGADYYDAHSQAPPDRRPPGY